MSDTARMRSIDALTMIEQRLPALSGASRRVAEAIVRDPWSVLGMTIYDVAEASGVSLPSVTRFCRAVGYPGFRELLQGIAQSLGRTDSKDFETLELSRDDQEGLPGLAAQIVRRQIDALQTTLHSLDYEAIEAATDALARARRVTVVGHGSAYVSALGMAVKLNWGGVPAFPATPDLYSNLVIAANEDDVVVGVSHQGRTRETIDLLHLARSFGATTIGISTVPQSPLAEAADITVAVLSPDIVRAGTFFIAYNAIMLLGDLFASAVAERRFGGVPPHREDVIEWIETNLRTGPASHHRSASHHRGKRRVVAHGADSTS